MWSIIKPFLRWNAPALHLIVCLLVVLVVLLAVDGYKALDGPGTSRNNNGSFTFRSSDITTLLSAAMIALVITASRWTGTVLWKCATVAWKKHGTDQLKWILEYKIHFWTFKKLRNSKMMDWAIVVTLLPIFPQLLSAPLLEGSVDWTSSSEFGAKVFVSTASPTVNYARWSWYSTGAKMSTAEIQSAVGFTGIAWENATTSAHTPRSQRCRHVVNDDHIRPGSVLHYATIPCIIIHNISWPTSPMPDPVRAVVLNGTMVSVSEVNPFSNTDNPGIAVLFDPTNTTLKMPPEIGLPNSTVNHLVAEPIYPSSFLFSGKMVVVVQLSKIYPFKPRRLDPFGYLDPNNVFGNGWMIDVAKGKAVPDKNYTYLEVDFTAGVSTPERSSYVTSKVVESGPLDPVKSDVKPGPWVKEALYMLPDVMVSVAIVNSTSLDTWNNIANYTGDLIRSSYMGAWSMLHNKFDPNNQNLTATLAEPRVQASVSKSRIIGWLGIQVLFVLTFLSISYIEQEEDEASPITGPADFVNKYCSRNGYTSVKQDILLQSQHSGPGGASGHPAKEQNDSVGVVSMVSCDEDVGDAAEGLRLV